MPSAKGKAITGWIARLTFLDGKALAQGTRKILEQKFVMYVFRDARTMEKTVKPAMDKVKGSDVVCELDVHACTVRIEEKVVDNGKVVKLVDAAFTKAIEALNG